MAMASARPGWIGRRQRGPTKERVPALWAVLAWIVGLVAFFPVLYMFLTGFKTEPAAVELPPKLIFWPTLENYREVFGINFWPFFRNSIIASLGSTALVMVLAVPCAYALALRPPKKWKDILFFFISTRFLPAAGVIVPLFIIFKDAGLLGTMRGLIILYTAMNLPIAVWMLRSFFEEVREAARVDGATAWQEFRDITFPHLYRFLQLGGLLGTVFIIQEVDPIYMMTNGGPGNATTTLPYLVYEKARESFDIGRGAAAGVIVVLISIVVITLLLWLLNRLLEEA